MEVINSDSFSIILSTVPSKEVGNQIANELIQKKLAACVQISSIDSHYFWQGEVQNDPEFQLQIKTRKALKDQVMLEISKMHPYEVPELLELPIISGSKAYLDWLNDCTSDS